MKQRLSCPTTRFAFIQGAYWMAYCILISFSSVYLLEKGFPNTEIGVLLSVSSVLSALIQPVAATKADQAKRFSLRQITAWLAFAMALSSLGLLLLPWKPMQALFFPLSLILLQLLFPFCSSLGMECINNHIPLNFGLARSFGPVTYGLASSLCGVLVALWGGTVLPLLLILLSLLLAGGILLFRFPASVGRTLPRAEALPQSSQPFLKKYRDFPILLVGLSLLFTSHNILLSFPFQIIRNLGGGSVDMGRLLTVMSIMDIPAMLFFSLLLRRGSSRFWLRLSSVSFFLHALLVWAAPNLPILFAVQIFEMTGYALQSVAVVYYVNQRVDLTDRVKGQTYFAMTNTIGIVLGSFVGGLLLDVSGVSAMMAFASSSGAMGMGILLVMLRRPVPVHAALHKSL